MKIAVIGAGRIGGTLGGKWEAAGHEVVYGLRNPSSKAGEKSIPVALSSADIVLLAIPGNATAQFARDNAAHLDGKVVIDATNNFGGPSMNSWPEVSSVVPKAKLYRAFNTYGFDVFIDPALGGERPCLFYAGPEGEGQKVVEQLISEVGLNPVWVGGTDAVDVVDGVLRLWFTLSRHRGRRIAFQLLSD
ncbi:MAG TPA: NAD(P)-binding domain-containing protein [Candidatus Dormibacteraeota bacterium]|nr:NAD(P)-binding domain-containing protein [Candidatus Dormibacteraeota bacterium]